MPRWMRPLGWFIVPIAVPGWLLEAAWRRVRGRFWEFGIWSGTFYLIALVGCGGALLISSHLGLRLAGFYVLTAIELLGILVVLALPVGNLGGYTTTLLALTRRKRRVASYAFSDAVGIAKPIWAALTAYLYTTGYFAVCGRLAFELDRDSFTGVDQSSQAAMLFDFFYATYVSMTTLGFAPGIEPTAPLTKAMYMVQVGISLAFLLLIFSVIVDQLALRRNRFP